MPRSWARRIALRAETRPCHSARPGRIRTRKLVHGACGPTYAGIIAQPIRTLARIHAADRLPHPHAASGPVTEELGRRPAGGSRGVAPPDQHRGDLLPG